jgi:protein involved in polysaccharide export with SLBB domain
MQKNRVVGFFFTPVLLALLCIPTAAQSGTGAGASSSESGSAQSSATNGSSQSSAQTGASQGSSQNDNSPATLAPNGNVQGSNQGSDTQGQNQGGNAQGNTQPVNARAAAQRITPVTPVPATTNAPAQTAASPSSQLPTRYVDYPSLSGLYTQVPSRGGAVERFGSEIFAFGSGNAETVPMDLPVGPDYVLGIGDSLTVNLWGVHSDHLNLTIDRQGQVVLPEAGPITINGLTLGQAQIAIQKALSTQFQDVHVEISMGRLRSIRVYVMGDVQRPGAYDVSSLATPLSALFAAGGPTARGSMRVMRVYRADKLVREIDLYDFLLHGIRSFDDRLQLGDTIMVPPVGAQVTVEGVVHHPAIYELIGEKTLNDVLNLAGGVLALASLKQINVERIIAHQSYTMVSLDLPDDAEGIRQKLEGFKVQGGDVFAIVPILPYNKQTVYFEGHVYRPGVYPYREGMTINDLVHSYADLLPEPEDRAELVRLLPPDYRPEVIPFNLADVLMGNLPIKLQPFDVIRIYGRYELEDQNVSIGGDVLRPGAYPLSKGMTLTDLMRMAGGFSRSAYRDEAELSSYEIQNGQKVLVNHSVVALQKALDGDTSADVLLKPGDEVSIPRLAGWQDIGSAVTISGEVEHAGSYGIVPGERLSTVVKRAGGFRADAYAPAAVFTRVQVQALAQQDINEMIKRIQETPTDFKPGAMTPETAQIMQSSLQQQRQQILDSLRSRPASGRMVIAISTDVSKWENTPADVELRAGDTLYIPKRPNFVMITGQVYNPIAIGYVPGKDLRWYLQKAGGPTRFADKKNIYVLRADGSVAARASSWTGNDLRETRLRPGDSVFVPQKVVTGSPVWGNILGIAQIMSAAALPLAIGGVF